jgi:hypothetical protein
MKKRAAWAVLFLLSDVYKEALVMRYPEGLLFILADISS